MGDLSATLCQLAKDYTSTKRQLDITKANVRRILETCLEAHCRSGVFGGSVPTGRKVPLPPPPPRTTEFHFLVKCKFALLIQFHGSSQESFQLQQEEAGLFGVVVRLLRRKAYATTHTVLVSLGSPSPAGLL